MLVYGDLFSYESQKLASYARASEERWILESFSNPSEEVKVSVGEMEKSTEELRELWTEHLRTYNIPLPIEEGWSSLRETGSEALIDGEVGFLRSAGLQK